VELEDGNVTNVGWKCGEGFGDKFAVERTRYAERELRPKAIRTIQDTIPKLRDMQQELAQLEAEADRISRCKQGMRRQVPNLYRELERRAHSSNDRVVEHVERTKKEIDDLCEMNPGSSRERFRYREESRGVLLGLRIIADNIREIVITNLTSKAEVLLTVNIGSLPTDKLLDWERWALRLEDKIAQARATITAGNQLFVPESFRLMAHFATTDSERFALAKLTPTALLRDEVNPTQGKATPTHPTALSKKQRDIQRRLEETLRKAQRRTR